jgi:hypothetical protein
MKIYMALNFEYVRMYERFFTFCNPLFFPRARIRSVQPGQAVPTNTRELRPFGRKSSEFIVFRTVSSECEALIVGCMDVASKVLSFFLFLDLRSHLHSSLSGELCERGSCHV